MRKQPGVLARFFKSMGAALGPRTYSTKDPGLYSLFGYGTYAGPNIDSVSAMQVNTVFTCVRVISETFGVMNGKVFERQKGSSDVVEVDHEVGDVLFRMPNDDMDAVNFGETHGHNLSLQGNSFDLIGRSGKSLTSLYPLNPDNVLKKRLDDGRIQYKYQDRGKWVDVDPEGIWHVRGFGNTGIMGVSPIGFQRQMLGMALATEEFQARFFANGASPSWLVTIPQWLEDNQREKAKRNLQELWGGNANAHKAQLLEGGMAATAATMPLQDAQFLELKKATKEDIFGMYRVPPHMGGELTRSTNNNIEQQALEFMMHCMLSYIRRMESAANRYLFATPEDRRRFFVRYDFWDLLRADVAARGDFYAKMLQNGVLSRNEVRSMERLNRSKVEGMDDYTIQTALAPVDTIRKIAEKLATIPPPPQPGGGDPSQNFSGGGKQDGKGLSTIVLNSTRLPDNVLHLESSPLHLREIVIPAPEVNYTPPEIKMPEVHVAAPEVKVHSPVTVHAPPPDLSPVADALKNFSDVAGRLIAVLEMDTDVKRDPQGNATGTRRVPRKD